MTTQWATTGGYAIGTTTVTTPINLGYATGVNAPVMRATRAGVVLPPRPKALARPHGQDQGTWYRIENTASGGTAEIHLFDEIGGWGIWASEFVTEMQAITASQINLHVNSPGGDVFDGLAIMNALIQHPARVTAYVDGIAASIASVISMAADEVVMAPHSMLMIHDAAGMCLGNADDMHQLGDLLDKISDDIASVYADKAGGTEAEWRAVMKGERWYLAQEAVDAGLANRINTPDGEEVQVDEAIAAHAGRWVDLVAAHRNTVSPAATHSATPQAPTPVVDVTPPAALPTPGFTLSELVCSALHERRSQ
jgi:ATP-dependent protease ClpP protease subunit